MTLFKKLVQPWELVLVCSVLLVGGCCLVSAQRLDTISMTIDLQASAFGQNYPDTAFGNFTEKVRAVINNAVGSNVVSVDTVVSFTQVPKITVAFSVVTNGFLQTFTMYHRAQQWVGSSSAGFVEYLTTIRTAASEDFGILADQLNFLEGKLSIPCRAASLNAGTPAPATHVCAQDSGRSSNLVFRLMVGVRAEPSAIQDIICSVMEITTCSKIVVGSVDSHIAGGYVTDITLVGLDSPFTQFLLVVAKVRAHNFKFSSLSVRAIALPSGFDEATVYSSEEGTIGSDSSSSNEIECDANSYWWLMFFILLFPLAFICAKQMYRSGKKHGSNRQRDMIREKREDELRKYGAGGGAPLYPHQQHPPPPTQQQQPPYQGGQQQQQQQQYPPPPNKTPTSTLSNNGASYQQQQYEMQSMQPPPPPQQQQYAPSDNSRTGSY